MDVLSFLSHFNLFPSGTPQFLTSNYGSLSYASLGSSTQLVIRDQTGADVTSLCTFSTGNAGIASVSAGGLVQSVGNGTTYIRATKGGLHVDVTTAVQQDAASITVTPNTPSVAVGSTVQLTAAAKDANNNAMTLPAGTWQTSDATEATVNGTGLVTGVAAGSVVIKYQVTGSAVNGTAAVTVTAAAGAPTINATTGVGIMGFTAAPIPKTWDAARLYTGAGYASPDDEWHQKKFGHVSGALGNYIRYDSTKNGGVTDGTEQYPIGDCVYIDLAAIVANSVVGGIPAFRFKFNPEVGSSPSIAQFMAYIPAGVRRVWLARRLAHVKPGQTNAPGDAHQWDITGAECVNSSNITYNTTGGGSGAGFKHGPYANDPAMDPSRAGVAGVANGGLDGTGKMTGQYQLDNYFNNTSPPGFADASATDIQTIDHAFDDGLPYDEIALVELIADGGGHDFAVTRFWKRAVNADWSVGAWKPVGAYATGTMQVSGVYHDGQKYTKIQWTSKNHNRAIEAPRYRDITEAGAYDASNPNNDGSDDPGGCLAADNAATPQPLYSAALNSTGNLSATFDLQRTNLPSLRTQAKKIRLVIDGVDQPAANDITVDPTIADLSSFQVTVTGLAVGTHTFAFKTVNGAGTLASAAVPASPISVTISATPNTPTVGNASSAMPFALRVPITVPASGGVPNAVAWQYSTDGGTTWTPGADVPLVGTIALGDALGVALGPLPTASQAYQLKVALKSAGGTSGYAAPVTGTTTAAAAITALPALSKTVVARWHAGYGTDTTTNAASLGGWQDAANKLVLGQLRDAKRPTFVTASQNGKPGVQMTGTQFLSSAGPITALNIQNQSFFTVFKVTGTTGLTRKIAVYLDSSANKGWALDLTSGNSYRLFYGDGTVTRNFSGGTVDTSAHSLEVHLDQGVPTKQSTRKDNVQLNGDAGGFAQNVLQALILGAADVNGGTSLGAAIITYYEGIALGGAASGTDQTNLETYFQTEWATP